MLLTELLTADRIRVPLGSSTKSDVLRELVGLVAAGQTPDVADAILTAVLEREAVLSTGVGAGVAIPHGKTPVVDQLVMAAGVVRTPLEFDALDGEPVELFFMLVGPESASSAHVKALSRISRLLRREQLRSGLRASETSHDFLNIVRASEAI